MTIHSADVPLWIKEYESSSAPRLRLLCFPHAGGSIATFSKWSAIAPGGMRIAAIQLPGRGRRSAESPGTCLRALAAAIGGAVVADGDPTPWVFFGHSFGGLLALETARWLAAHGFRTPTRLVLASAVPPHLISKIPMFQQRGSSLLDALHGLGGLPDALQRQPRLAALWLPRIEADLDLALHYESDQPSPIPCSITALVGVDDHLIPAAIAAQWRQYTTDILTLQAWPGGHFAILDNPAIVFGSALPMPPPPPTPLGDWYPS